MNRITSVVIIPLYEVRGTTSILFTKRNQKMKHHPGEISFPGGKVENGEGYFEAAKRETIEEINCVVTQKLGTLKPVMTLVSNHLILPFIAFIDIQKLTLNKDEVEAVFSTPLDAFLKTKMRKKRFSHRKIFITTPVWDFQEFYAWGATGRILFDFKNWLKKHQI